MSVCEKIEVLLWNSLERELSFDEISILDAHLSECEKCREIRETLSAIAESRKFDKSAIAEIDPDDFANSVFDKIRTREREMRFKRQDRGYTIRLYLSVGLAAAVVAFMVLSLGDLDRYILPIKSPVKESIEAGKKYDTLHITLQPKQPEALRQSENLPTSQSQIQDEPVKTEKQREPDYAGETKALKIIPPPVLAEFEDTTMSSSAGFAMDEKPMARQKSDLYTEDYQISDSIPPESDRDMVFSDTITSGDILRNRREYLGKKSLEYSTPMESFSGTTQTEADFSILRKPVSNPAPDSVVINSIFLSDESIPMATQQTRAFLPDVIMDSGMVQSIKTPRSVLVTVDKMPVPVKIIPPEYPVWAKKNGISGVVWIKARVDKDGNVSSAEVLSSNMPGYGFEEASLTAAKECEYVPAEANGYKIEISVLYPVKFIFKNEDK